MATEAEKLGQVLGRQVKEQDTIKQNISPDESAGQEQLAQFESLIVEGDLTITKKEYDNDIFILDHPVYGDIDSSTLRIDGGYKLISGSDGCEVYHDFSNRGTGTYASTNGWADLHQTYDTQTAKDLQVNYLSHYWALGSSLTDYKSSGAEDLSKTGSGVTETGDHLGVPQGASLFDGTHYLTTSGSIALAASSDFTFECWFKQERATDDASSDFLMFMQNGTDTLYIKKYQSTNYLRYYAYIQDSVDGNVGTGFYFPDATSATKWAHLIFTYDHSALAAYVYLNGSLVATMNFNNGFKGVTSTLGIGQPWVGRIAEVKLLVDGTYISYNTEEVEAAYSQSSSYRMYDSYHEQNGIKGAYSHKCFYYHHGDVIFADGEPQSLSCWVKWDGGYWAIPFGNEASSTNSIYFYDNQDLLKWRNPTGAQDVTLQTQQLYDGELHHLVLTVDSSRNIAMYIDGSAAGTGTLTDSSMHYAGIGRGYNNARYHWKGFLGNYQIFNKELTTTEIEHLYSSFNEELFTKTF